MPSGLTVWVVLVAVGAAALLVHFVNLYLALRGDVSRGWKVLALVPPATPYVAWRAGRRVAPALWGLLLVAYAVLRLRS